jgi:hypothetical protein
MNSTIPLVAQQDSAALSVAARARASSRVVVATAVNVTPSWQTSQYGDRLIVSRVTLQVEQMLKGTAANSVVMDVEGGTIGDLTLRVSSQTPVNVGDRAVFFLDQTATGIDVPHLKGQGVLKLTGNDEVQGLGLRLEDIRRAVQAVAAR